MRGRLCGLVLAPTIPLSVYPHVCGADQLNVIWSKSGQVYPRVCGADGPNAATMAIALWSIPTCAGQFP